MSLIFALLQKIDDLFVSPHLPLDRDYSYAARHAVRCPPRGSRASTQVAGVALRPAASLIVPAVRFIAVSPVIAAA
ncbi:hypothetical protein [Burkholderia gladioli]|uniref:hypothetical protein n=1 Tax=Burkholderia gladioli TaxID=28095 RepID=UPI001641177E|nr:hypothetical protein [Burkholderia gladioli]